MLYSLKKQIPVSELRLLVGIPDLAVMRSIFGYMEPLGYHLDNCSNSDEVLESMLITQYDALILDAALTDTAGIPLYSRLRMNGFSRTIILLTHDDDLEKLPRYVNAGADDVVTSPPHMLELETRLLASIRLSRAHFFSTKMSWEGIELDMQAHTVTCEGKSLHLPPMAFTILSCLMKAAPNVVSREELENRLYGKTPPPSDAFRVYIHILRNHLAKVNRPILKTVPRVGFRLAAMPPGESRAL